MTLTRQAATVGSVTTDDRGAALRARREHLGMSKAALAKLAGVDRGKLQRFEDGVDVPSDRWIGGVLRALDEFEAETGHEPGEAEAKAQAGYIRIEVKGVYGAEALIVQGPPENLPELEAMIDRLMRRRAAEQADEQG